jgi:hypothetical protein
MRTIHEAVEERQLKKEKRQLKPTSKILDMDQSSSKSKAEAWKLKFCISKDNKVSSTLANINVSQPWFSPPPPQVDE